MWQTSKALHSPHTGWPSWGCILIDTDPINLQSAAPLDSFTIGTEHIFWTEIHVSRVQVSLQRSKNEGHLNTIHVPVSQYSSWPTPKLLWCERLWVTRLRCPLADLRSVSRSTTASIGRNCSMLWPHGRRLPAHISDQNFYFCRFYTFQCSNLMNKQPAAGWPGFDFRQGRDHIQTGIWDTWVLYRCKVGGNNHSCTRSSEAQNSSNVETNYKFYIRYDAKAISINTCLWRNAV